MSTTARIDELRKKFDENPRRYFAPLANELRKAGDLAQAIALCQEHLPKQPGHMSGYIVFGQALFESGMLLDAQAVFEQALDLDPENLIALRHLGDIARSMGEISSARRWYERVLDADPRNEDIAAELETLRGLATPASGATVVTPPTPVASPALVSTPVNSETAIGFGALPTPDSSLRAVDFDAVNQRLARFSPLDLEAIENAGSGSPFGEPDAGNEKPSTFATAPSDFGVPGEKLTGTPVSDRVVDPHLLRAVDVALDAFEANDPADQLHSDAIRSESETAEPLWRDAGGEPLLAGSDDDWQRPSPNPQEPDGSVGDLAVEFEEGILAPEWPEASMLAERLLSPRAITPTVNDVSEDSANAFGQYENENESESESENGDIDEAALAQSVASSDFHDEATVDAEPSLAPHELSDDDADPIALPPTDLPWLLQSDAEVSIEELAEMDADDEAGGLASSSAGGTAFVTETMAELFVSQGLVARAISVYEELVERHPYDPVLTSRLQELRQQSVADQAAMGLVAPVVDQGAVREANDGSPSMPTPVSSGAEWPRPTLLTPPIPSPTISTPAYLTPVYLTVSDPVPPAPAPSVLTPAYSIPIVATPANATPAYATPAYATPAYATPASTPPSSATTRLSPAPATTSVEPPSAAATVATALTARERFARLAARRVPRRTPTQPAVTISETPVGLAAIFGDTTERAADDSAARALADAFATLPDETTRGGDLLDFSVRDVEASQSAPFAGLGDDIVAPRESADGDGTRSMGAVVEDSNAGFSFDRFFPDPAAAGTPLPPPPAGTTAERDPIEPVADDLAQFSAWLKGLGSS